MIGSRPLHYNHLKYLCYNIKVIILRGVIQVIELKNINKSFKIAKRSSGFLNATKALFKKEYTEVNALQDVSFTIQPGEIVGYIGPNGAGKSSTIKVMSGILVPDSGSCLINGITPWENRKEHVRDIGVVFGQRSQLWWEVPVMDSFELLRDIYNIDNNEYQSTLNNLTERLNLGDLLNTPTRQLSLGQRMRCEIAASLLHSPSILFLDEPTIGLDAVSKIAVREFIKELNMTKQTTIILTTHDMQDIEALTNRILLIGNGQILLDGSLSELKEKQSQHVQIIAQFHSGKFEPLKGLALIDQQGNRGIFAVDTHLMSTSRAIEILAQQLDINTISVKQASAEELVVNLYEEFEI